MNGSLIAVVFGIVCQSPVEAGYGWIDKIINNTNVAYYIRSHDRIHNGRLHPITAQGVRTADPSIELDGKQWHYLAAGQHYLGEWCGVPWYHEGKQFKCLSRYPQGTQAGREKHVQFWQSERGGQNWIEWANGENQLRSVSQLVNDGDYHCFLYIEYVNPEGEVVSRFDRTPGVDKVRFRIEIKNQQYSGDKALEAVFDGAKWIIETGIKVAEVAASLAGGGG